MPDWFFPIMALALGGVIGSFLNVVIHRYPREESIISPASRCPRCGSSIRPWDNVPVVSFLLLGGRCRSCREPISVRYPLVELANALFYLAIIIRTGPTIAFLLLAAIVSMTITLIYIDAEIQILPDIIDLPGVIVGLGIAVFRPGQGWQGLLLADGIRDSIIGALAGAGIIWTIAAAYRLIRGVEGMGMGDLKMMAMIGATVGWRAVIVVLFVASFTGAAVGILAAMGDPRGLRTPLPFGVFLGFALLAMMFFGQSFGAAFVAWNR